MYFFLVIQWTFEFFFFQNYRLFFEFQSFVLKLNFNLKRQNWKKPNTPISTVHTDRKKNTFFSFQKDLSYRNTVSESLTQLWWSYPYKYLYILDLWYFKFGFLFIFKNNPKKTLFVSFLFFLNTIIRFRKTILFLN